MLDTDQKRGTLFISDIAFVSKCEERPKAPLLTFFWKIHFNENPQLSFQYKAPLYLRGAKIDWNWKLWVFSFPEQKIRSIYLKLKKIDLSMYPHEIQFLSQNQAFFKLHHKIHVQNVNLKFEENSWSLWLQKDWHEGRFCIFWLQYDVLNIVCTYKYM